jgi:hypothetical protein
MDYKLFCIIRVKKRRIVRAIRKVNLKLFKLEAIHLEYMGCISNK